MKLFKVYYKEGTDELWIFMKEKNKVNVKTKFWLMFGIYPTRTEEKEMKITEYSYKGYIIQKVNNKWCLYSEHGGYLGSYRKLAEIQEYVDSKEETK